MIERTSSRKETSRIRSSPRSDRPTGRVVDTATYLCHRQEEISDVKIGYAVLLRSESENAYMSGFFET